MPGVVGVYTAGDLELGALPFVWPITEDIKVPVHYALASDKVRFNGDAVAVVVAETREQALDAAEVVAVTATELPAVVDIEDAAKDEVIVHGHTRVGYDFAIRMVGVRLVEIGSREGTTPAELEAALSERTVASARFFLSSGDHAPLVACPMNSPR